MVLSQGNYYTGSGTVATVRVLWSVRSRTFLLCTAACTGVSEPCSAIPMSFLHVLAQATAVTTTNLTVYRITPRNYTGVTNMDTGSPGGDSFFGLYELSFPVLCADPHFRRSTGCTNEPILSIPHFNVYQQAKIEADTRFGDYSQCNPNPDTGVFECTHFHQTSCWTANERYAKAFAGVCDPKECKCDAIEKMALGVQSMEQGFGPPTNGTLPPTCSKPIGDHHLTPLDGKHLKGLAYKNESGLTAGECCSQCNAEAGRKWFPCRGYSFVSKEDASDATGTCARYSLIWGGEIAKGVQSAYSFSHMHGGSSAISFIFDALPKLAEILGGFWYSTQAAGVTMQELKPSTIRLSLPATHPVFEPLCGQECKGKDDVIGKDCWWRLHSVERLVNSSCVNDRLIDTVLTKRPSCFAACPQPHNQSSTCWIQCLFETLVGNQTSSPPVLPMTKATLTNAFEAAFAPESAGGCPEVPPCPPPCKAPPMAAFTADSQTRQRLRPNLPWRWL